MELNSNFRKRRLLEDTGTVTSSNSPIPMRDVGTATVNTIPMTLDAYTQTDVDNSSSGSSCRNLEKQIERIFQVLSKHDSILNEIRNAVLDNNNQSTNILHNSTSSTPVPENSNYKIVTSGEDAISIEPVKPEDIIEETLPPDAVTYVTSHYEPAKIQNQITVQSSTASPTTQMLPPIYRYGNSYKLPNFEQQEQQHIQFHQQSPVPPKIEYPFVNNKNILGSSNYIVKPVVKNIKQEMYHSTSSTPENRPALQEYTLQDNNSPQSQPQSNEMVKIGPNGTCILKSIYESMEWKSASASTRKLLTTIFSRQVLATHSLTGRPSPAFHGREKPSKHQLDPERVADIIAIVTKKCGVSDKDVRTAITTKCADENKMLNQRQRRKLNKENVELNATA